ncbi:MAG: Dna2/Cas4 domain-containing protein [Clostridiales bacterium]|nr:Dna2/Cas4 domain-containing protein [Clostridiales bacterium]
MYCPRRWGLLEINDDWEENIYVIKANLMHKRVHSGEHDYSSKNKKVISSLSVYNDELDIYGVIDCVEFKRDKNGRYIKDLNDKFNITIVEYKPTKPKDKEFWPSDAIQVFAQKLCVDYVFKCDSEACIYYGDVRRRSQLPFKECFEDYLNEIKGYLKNMRSYMAKNTIPQIRKGQRCSGCSLEYLCLPRTKNIAIKQQILSTLGDKV